jgi:pyrimidine oxygenase
MQLGVFIPIGNNGWLISTTSPQYKPSFDLNKTVVQKAEAFGFDFALSMIKLHGFGGPSRFWDYNLESFTLMAGLASVTSRIQLFATCAVLTMPPPFTARMATTIDSISHGRFGVNIISGWQRREYAQMGIWPGSDHYNRRYDYCSEYVMIMKELWATGQSDFKGDFFQMDDCRCLPMPTRRIPLICAGQSDRGTEFAVAHADYNFCSSFGINDPHAVEPSTTRLVAANAAAGTDCGALVVMMVIAEETDEAAFEKWEHYRDGMDMEALGWRQNQAEADPNTDKYAGAGRWAEKLRNRMPTMHGALIGSYERVAAMLDDYATVPGVEGVMLTFDDFVAGMDKFGQRIQPLMATRRHVLEAV